MTTRRSTGGNAEHHDGDDDSIGEFEQGMSVNPVVQWCLPARLNGLLGFRDRRLFPRDVDSEEPLLVLRVMNNLNLLPADTGFGDAALRMAVGPVSVPV